MNCSPLKAHLFSKNIIDSPHCQCDVIEDTYHYFFDCPLHNEIRQQLMQNLSFLGNICIRDLLFGRNDLSPDTNSTIFKHVHTFIRHSKRFWLAVHGKPVLFWKGTSGWKFPCFLFYACERDGPI